MGHGASFVAVDGAWLTDSASSAPRYAVIHRCAVSAQASRRGVMSQMFLEGERLARAHGCESMRIDTHMRNVGLRGLAEKLGYTRCGTITLPYPEDERPAAHRIRKAPVTIGNRSALRAKNAPPNRAPARWADPPAPASPRDNQPIPERRPYEPLCPLRQISRPRPRASSNAAAYPKKPITGMPKITGSILA